MSPSTESLTSRSPFTHQRPLQVQFVYYKASGVPGDDQCDSPGALGAAGSNNAQFDSQRADGGDFANSEIPISALLPDRKCPFRTCEYHTKGFVRKHDLVRHIITHYDGRLYCGFCPNGLAKSFGRPFLRVEPLKRHLAAVHGAAKFRKTQNTTEAYLRDRIREHGSVGAGHCSVCVRPFASAAELYGHIEGCVVQLLLLRAREDNGNAAPLDRAAIFQPAILMEEAGWNAGSYILATENAGALSQGGH
ncbi:hypothetical protein Sste5346_010027 [Sporothrix stenoceras]|uniref:C2H2-type domain-containing protein n=1 Tax=Sporothrix stenoceras TaxID=5173 RepID=A0ABR3YJX1_9PEZI